MGSVNPPLPPFFKGGERLGRKGYPYNYEGRPIQIVFTVHFC